MNNSDYNRTVARTILSQLGGNRFVAMTGARQFVALEAPGLQFDLPARFAKSGINRIRIVLDPSDTYTVSAFTLCRRSFECPEISSQSGVYCDMLESVFSEFTGLSTRIK
ncbi:hypothetical protein CS022_18275 [Veronia nyctiphanis]|uniref:Uncharacterized protein n=1 Tax=Veronia nyctiphanis TaxID=1278244 RepID=A0A4Q0YMP1_9GAMM|nr:hypothetical protein [Veronia nyctiphanis]RXJ72026.1 hypothetical protein CS022_17995 [Veronia nyctiphanis]RXJ72073.1 hypothetical protein CS022_18275 [Veronia nyctiphanis]